MDMKIKVSVCVPVYNVEKYIERCARSLFGQTMRDGIEFIFVDDCSHDGSVGVLNRVLADYPYRQPQVLLLRHEENRGRVAARRNALQHARGSFVVYCDADDRVDADLYEKMLSIAEAGQCDVVAAPIRMIWPDGREQMLDSTCVSVQSFFDDWFGTTHFNSLCNKMVKAELYRSTDTHERDELVYGEDLLQTSLALMDCKRIGFVHDACYNYFREDDSGTISRKDSELHIRHFIQVERILSKRLAARSPESLAYLRHMICMLIIRNGQFAEGEFKALWPESRTWTNLNGDHHLQFYKKILLKLCAANYSLGIALAQMLMSLERFVHRKVS